MKKLIKIIGLTILILAMMFFGLYFVQNHLFLRSFERDYQEEKIRNTQELIRCNHDIFRPEYAFVFDLGEGESKHIGFHKTKKLFFQIEQDWEDSRTGGTTITNTTFPELVKMVKEDCSQFQEDYDNPNPETGIDWGYREADPPELPKTEHELEAEKAQHRYDSIRALKYAYGETFTDFQQEKFTEMFGDVKTITDDEIYAIFLEIQEAGGMEVVFRDYLFDEDGNIIFRMEE